MTKRNRKEVPEFVKKVKMPLFDTLLLEHEDITLTVYQGKSRKKCLIIEPLQATVDIDNNHPKKLPETISFYNSTKFSVDIADQMARNYSVKRQNQKERWQVYVFYTILDLAGINSWILYKIVTGKKLTRFNNSLQCCAYSQKKVHVRGTPESGCY
ncbi:catenin alpha [Trichonephila clavipes]|nr:catenin alpha [Trichonephila clavipes]